MVGGIVVTLPTATSESVGLDQYLLGPELLIAKVGRRGALGLLLTHQWAIAGEDSFDTSITRRTGMDIANRGWADQDNHSERHPLEVWRSILELRQATGRIRPGLPGAVYRGACRAVALVSQGDP